MFIGEVAHIISGANEGPRRNPLFPRARINHSSNLLVLCPTHHAEVDRNETEWTPDKLRTIKDAHEEGVRRRQQWRPWNPSYAAVHYINVPRLAALAALYGVQLGAADGDQLLHDDADFLALVRYMNYVERVISEIQPLAIPLSEIKSLGAIVPGTLISFNRGLRTKNMPWSVGGGSEVFTGNLDRDPHLYFNWGNFRVVMGIDVRWVTTSTARSDLCGGSVVLSGLIQTKGRLGRVGRRSVITASPLILGLEAAPPARSFRTERFLRANVRGSAPTRTT